MSVFKVLGNPEYQHHIRTRTVGDCRLYIYKDISSKVYVLQEERLDNGRAVESHNVAYDSSLGVVMAIYNRVLADRYDMYDK